MGSTFSGLFSHVDNTQLPKFYGRFWCPGTAGDVNWWVPPVSLIGRVLRHTEACNAMGNLIVPIWKFAPFWPLLCPDGSHLASFVHQWVCTPFQPTLFIPGRSEKVKERIATILTNVQQCEDMDAAISACMRGMCSSFCGAF